MSFATPGWDLNASAIAPEQALSKAAQKKRKHQEASANGATEEAPAVNVEALLTKFHALEQKNKPKPTSKKGKDGAKGQAGSKNEMPADGPVSKGAANKESGKGEAGKKRQRNKRNKQQQKIAVEPSSEPDVSFATAPSSPDRSEMLLEEPSKKKQRRGSGASTNKNPESMSTLQSSMKTKLGGARFRWINEQLYTTSGDAALQLMENDPSVFDEYHTGFRSQAATWPVHPLDIIISSLKDSLPARSLVVDLGAGDARLAQELHQNTTYKAISYDLVPKAPWVSVAQCSQLGGVPLPGDEAAVADAVVCSLSLMGTDWPNQIQECHRLLKSGGLLKIAEVSSRFTDIKAFVKLVESVGFKSKSKDETNTHFVLFDFEKNQSTRPETDVELAKGSSLLKPCLYKKRG